MLNRVAASALLPRKLRPPLLRTLGVRVGRRTSIAAGCFIGSRRRMAIGEAVSINYGCFFDTTAQVQVDDRCNFGPRVVVVTSTHEPGGPERRAGRLTGRPVKIGSGCWIGAGATILPGVTVGCGSVVAAGAVVASDCDRDGVYAGVPARLVRPLAGSGEHRGPCPACPLSKVDRAPRPADPPV